jgi:hypothetical protein
MNVMTGKQKKGGLQVQNHEFFFKQLTICDKNLDSQEINNNINQKIFNIRSSYVALDQSKDI